MRRTPTETRALWFAMLRAAGPIAILVLILVAAGIFVIYQATSFVYRR